MPTVTEHMLFPNITLDHHVRSSRISLGEELSKRRAIYLDTNYWILLRKANWNSAGESAVDLLDLLRKGVAAGALFCPISETVFLELMKQGDLSSRQMTATLIDELSLGATLVQQGTRLETEIAHFVYSNVGKDNLHPIEHLVWSKLSYVLGFTHPTNTAFDPMTEVAVQKAFFDHMWTISLSEMVTFIGASEMPGTDLSEIANTLNVGSAAHTEEIRSFKQAYAAEVRGIVDVVGCVAIDVAALMRREMDLPPQQLSPEQRQNLENRFKNLFSTVLERGQARDALRTMHILASLHASVRWDKRRKLRSNDLFDFDHAAAALAYCDAFFTEGPLRTMVTQRHLALDKLYGCYVAAEMDAATAYLHGVV